MPDEISRRAGQCTLSKEESTYVDVSTARFKVLVHTCSKHGSDEAMYTKIQRNLEAIQRRLPLRDELP
jgi:hypothetical protein